MSISDVLNTVLGAKGDTEKIRVQSRQAKINSFTKEDKHLKKYLDAFSFRLCAKTQTQSSLPQDRSK